MSEKHLTELAWKTLAMKHKIKETKLATALGAFGKCDARNTAVRTKLLGDIEKEAGALKRDQKANKEVETYLGEIVKEVETTRKAAEPVKKAPSQTPPVKDKAVEEKGVKGKEEKEGKEKEGEDAGGAKKKAETGGAVPPSNNLKGALTGAMAKVKSRKPDDPPMGAMLCQLGQEYGVLLSGNVGSAHQNILKQVLKGTGHKFAKGTCEWGKDDVYTFVLESPLGGAARGLKLFFQKYAGASYKLRVGAAGAMEEELTTTGATTAPDVTGGAKPPGDGKQPEGDAGTKPNPTLSSYVKAKRDWKAAKAAAEKGIATLKAAILQQCDPELEAPVKAKIDAWDSILAVVDDNVMIPLIDAAIKETEPDRQVQHNQKLASTTAHLLAALQQHRLASVADANPFGKFFIRGPLNMMLTHLGESFGAGA